MGNIVCCGAMKTLHLVCRVITAAVGWLLLVPVYALEVAETPASLTVTGAKYRARFSREVFGFDLALRDAAGVWRSVTKQDTAIEFGVSVKDKFALTTNARVQLAQRRTGAAVMIGVRAQLSPLDGLGATLHFICTEEGILMQFKPAPGEPLPAAATCWTLPRIGLDELCFDAYTFWAADGRRHSGPLAALGKEPAYAGVTVWDTTGDIVPRFSTDLPAVIVRSEKTGVALGVVLVDPAGAWREGHTFVQCYRPDVLYLYAGNTHPVAAQRGNWGWLAPCDGRDTTACEQQVKKLLTQTASLLQAFQPSAPPALPAWTVPPDTPAPLRRAQPVADIADAMVFTMNEEINTPYGMTLARKTCSDLLIRAWFKWHNAPDWSRYRQFPPEAHALGMLFGGGITCSALYDSENNLTEAAVRDMATRDPAGNLVNAWNTPGCHHGSLSNPRYLEYLLRWCRQQIDAGADYLFMDEHTAVLEHREGYDDYSNHDFRDWLHRTYGVVQNWSPTDARWRQQFGLDPADRSLCPDGTSASFDYRAWLRQKNCLADPLAPQNTFRDAWQKFRHDRDDRAWKQLTGDIRAYAASKGRRVFISANGLARYVDLQVLGVWDAWRIRGDRVELGGSQLDAWSQSVRRGHALAGHRVPVVFFHDWGFGGFPWLRVPPSDRELWMRVRGAEIYAAGGFFAFPVTGPFGCDALKDGTLGTIAHLTRFYREQSDLYRHAKPVALDALKTDAADLGTALAIRSDPPALILHLINHATRDHQLQPRQNICVDLPVSTIPTAVAVVSPDGAGTAHLDKAGDHLRLRLEKLEAYAAVVLSYPALPTLTTNYAPHLVPENRWAKPARSDFTVLPGGEVEHELDLISPLQGRLHQHLRNPPTFVINAPQGGQLLVHVRAVATAGARLELREGTQMLQAFDLPDRDGKNDGSAHEWDRTLTFNLPPGQHRLTLDNTGGDWAALDWLCFCGNIVEPSATQFQALEKTR
jgi:hypothetical protein